MANRDHEPASTSESSNSSNPATANKSPDSKSTDLRSKARRRLDFGDTEVGEDALRLVETEDVETRRQKAIEKWNFDFEDEVPLPGDWEWEKVPVNVPDNKEVIHGMAATEKEHNRNV